LRMVLKVIRALLTRALLTRALLTQALLTQALLTRARIIRALLTRALLTQTQSAKDSQGRHEEEVGQSNFFLLIKCLELLDIALATRTRLAFSSALVHPLGLTGGVARSTPLAKEDDTESPREEEEENARITQSAKNTNFEKTRRRSEKHFFFLLNHLIQQDQKVNCSHECCSYKRKFIPSIKC
jgi:hypothetical protein